MRKQRIAESLLALVTPRERAASTAGDLTEQAGVRGNLWFWSNVLRTVGAMIWRSFAAEPFKLLWLGLRGSLLGLVLSNAAQLLAVAVSVGIIRLVFRGFAPPGVPFDSAKVLHGWVLWAYYAAILGAPVLSMFQVGRWVARRAPGRETTAGVTLIAMQFPLAALLTMIVSALDARGIQPPSGSWHAPSDMLPLLAAMNLAGFLANLAGAIHVRRQAAR